MAFLYVVSLTMRRIPISQNSCKRDTRLQSVSRSKIPKLAKGIVRREVIRVLTPGLSIDSLRLGKGENNYLMAFCVEGEVFGLAFLDISTGEFRTCQLSGFESFLNEVFRNEPKEILTFRKFQQHACFERFKKLFEKGSINYLDDAAYEGLHSPGRNQEAVPGG